MSAERGPFGSAPQPKITTPCPACGAQSLFIGSGGGLTCAVLGCPQPGTEVAVREAAHLFGRMAMAVLQGDWDEALRVARLVRIEFDAQGPFVSRVKR